MKETLKNIFLRLFTCIFITCSIIVIFHAESLYASENDNLKLINKISQSYTNKFCNAIGFGLSKESAVNFAMKENIAIFKKKKGIENIDNNILVEKVSFSVVNKCGYPLNLSEDQWELAFKKSNLN